MSLKANQNQSELIRPLFDEARHLIEQGDHECAVKMLQECLHLKPESKMKASILDDLGFCSLSWGGSNKRQYRFQSILKSILQTMTADSFWPAHTPP